MKAFTICLVLTIFGCCAVFGGVVIDQEHKDHFNKSAKECMSETGATDADLKEMIADKTSSTKEGKCLKSCLMIKYKSMDDNGKLNREGSLHIAEKLTKNNEKIMELAGQILDACIDLGVSDDKCEAAEEYSECMIKKARDLGLKEMVM